MATGTTTSGTAGSNQNLAALYSTIQQTALFTMQEVAFMRPLVRNYNLVGQPGKTARVGIYPTIATSNITTGEGTDISAAQRIDATEKEFTATEKAIMATLTDTARDSTADDSAAAIGRILGETLAKKIDEDIAALFSGFSGSIGGGSGTELTPDDILGAIATLRGNSVTGPYVGVFHPYQTYNLRKVLANAGAATTPALSDVGNEVLRMGYIGRLFGVDIYESAVVTGTSAGAYVGAVMHSDALAFCLKKDLSIETQRDASLRATEIVASCTYAVGELFDGHGVKIITDASISN